MWTEEEASTFAAAPMKFQCNVRTYKYRVSGKSGFQNDLSMLESIFFLWTSDQDLSVALLVLSSEYKWWIRVTAFTTLYIKSWTSPDLQQVQLLTTHPDNDSVWSFLGNCKYQKFFFPGGTLNTFFCALRQKSVRPSRLRKGGITCGCCLG